MNRRPTTQDISWFLDLRKNNQIELNPSYQRRSVWTRKDKQYFLDTIFRSYPCPAIFLHKQIFPDGKQIYNVVDGKQRLETIFSFIDGKISIPKEFGDSKLNGKKWAGLNTDDRQHFWNYVLPVEFINLSDGQVINEAFDRLNRNSWKLKEQELRHSQFSGWFISLVEKESEEKFWKDIGVATIARAKRMQDVQFISELFLISLEKKMMGFDQETLSNSYAAYDDLSETDLKDSEEKIREEIENTKQFLSLMEKTNKCISESTSALQNLYTLWAYIVLKKPSSKSAKSLAPKYSKFLANVEELRNITPEQLKVKLKVGFKNEFTYLENTRGASTDLPQREARLKALTKALV